MKLHSSVPGFVIILLLSGMAGSAQAQSPNFRFGSARGTPTRLFGSSDDFGCSAACGKATTFGSQAGFGCAQKSCSRPAINLAAILKRPSDCGCKSSCDCAADKRCGNPSGCSCRRPIGIGGLSKAFDKLDGAVKKLFHCNRSVCCDPCYYPARSCTACPPKGYNAGCGCEPAWTPLPPPQHDVESPSMEGDPFEDDPVPPLPAPVPSEARRHSDVYIPVRAASYTQPARRQGATSTRRPDKARSTTERERLTQSMLDCLD